MVIGIFIADEWFVQSVDVSSAGLCPERLLYHRHFCIDLPDKRAGRCVRFFRGFCIASRSARHRRSKIPRCDEKTGRIGSGQQFLIRYLPELKGSGYEAASIEDLLEMSSGAKFSHNLDDPKSDSNVMANVVAQGDGKVRDFLKSIRSAEPAGREFAYDDRNAQVLGWLVTLVTGQSLAD